MDGSEAAIEALHVGDAGAFVRDALSDHSVGSRSIDVVSEPDVAAARDRLGTAGFDCLIVETGVDWRGVLDAAGIRGRHQSTIVLAHDPGVVEEALDAGATDGVVRRPNGNDALVLRRRVANLVQRGSAPPSEDGLSELLLDTIEDAFYLVDTEGNLVRWNRQLSELTGYSDAELAGMDAFDLVSPEDHDLVAEQMAQTIEDGQGRTEVRLATKDGDRVPVDVTGATITDAAGTVTGIVGIGRDLSERKALESELRKTANLLAHVFDQIPTALYVKDEEGRHIRMSEYDRDPTEKSGKTDPEIYGESEFTAETYADDMRVIEEGERIINKEEYNPRNGEWTLTSKVPWRDDEGEIQGLIGVSRFITEKKEYEEKLRVRNRAMAEAPVGITIHEVTDDGAPVTYTNAAIEQITGYGRESLAAEGPELLAGPDTDPEKVRRIEKAFTEAEETTVVLLQYDADGEPYWGRVSVAPVTDDTGTVTHTVGFLQDVTETKRRAEEIERRLAEFADLLAEEVSTPLAAAEDALASADDGASDAIATAEQSIERADKLVTDLTEIHSFSVKSRGVFETDGDDNGT